jgi:glycosyltransferase involved in cell wall biosynthesis
LDNRKKLTYILHNVEVGGVEVALVSAIPKLHEKYRVRVVVLGSVNKEMVGHLSLEERNAFAEFDYPVYLYPFKLARIIRFISRDKPDIMIASLWRASLVGSIVKWLHPAIKFFSFNHSTRFPHYFSALFTRIAAKTADVILTDGEATSEFVRKQLKPKVPVRSVSFLTQPTPTVRSVQIPDANHEIRFMFLGRINRVKNLPLIVKLIEDLRKRSVNATLDIYGRNDNGDAQEVESLVSKGNLGQYIRFKGEIAGNKRSSLFQHYHFYVQLSSFEGMAMSVAEAMQHGLVCVVSPVGEIVHYSEDMQSAIFIHITRRAECWENDLDKICKVINDSRLYEKISVTCHSNFLDKRQYPDSLIEQLEK